MCATLSLAVVLHQRHETHIMMAMHHLWPQIRYSTRTKTDDSHDGAIKSTISRLVPRSRSQKPSSFNGMAGSVIFLLKLSQFQPISRLHENKTPTPARGEY